MREQRCCASAKGSPYSSLQSWQMNSPSGRAQPPRALAGASTGPSLMRSPSTGDVVTSSSKVSLRIAFAFLPDVAFCRPGSAAPGGRLAGGGRPEAGGAAGAGGAGAPPGAGPGPAAWPAGGSAWPAAAAQSLSSAGAKRSGSMVPGTAGAGKDSAETGEPRLKPRSSTCCFGQLILDLQSWKTRIKEKESHSENKSTEEKPTR
ncbi:uncharacterized protein ACIBXB_008404 [Morphnus guianensis]